MEIERFKEWMSFFKFFIGTVILGIVATVINYHFQAREIEIKEMEQLGAYIEQVIDDKPVVQKRFAQYFETMTASDAQRIRWQQYLVKIDSMINESLAELKEIERMKGLETDSAKSIENGVEDGTIKVADLENRKAQVTDPAEKQVIESLLQTTKEDVDRMVAQRYEAERTLAQNELDVRQLDRQLTYSRKADVPKRKEKSGWIYLGNYDQRGRQWETTYFNVGSRTPGELSAGVILRVSSKASNVRAGMPDPGGRFREIIDVIVNGTQVEIVEVKKWSRTSYWWASVTYTIVEDEIFGH